MFSLKKNNIIVRRMDLLIQLIKKNLLIPQINFLFFSEKKTKILILLSNSNPFINSKQFL